MGIEFNDQTVNSEYVAKSTLDKEIIILLSSISHKTSLCELGHIP